MKRNKMEIESLKERYKTILDMFEEMITNKELLNSDDANNFLKMFYKDKSDFNEENNKKLLNKISESLEKIDVKKEIYNIFSGCVQEKKHYNQYIIGDFIFGFKSFCEEKIKEKEAERIELLKNKKEEEKITKEKEVLEEGKEVLEKEKEVEEEEVKEMELDLENETEEENKEMDLKKWIQGGIAKFPFNKITRREREIISMYHIKKWTDAEIAEKLKVAPFEAMEKRLKIEEKLKKMKESEENN